MRIAVFSTNTHDREILEAANATTGYDLLFFEATLNEQTCRLAGGCPAVRVFVNDVLNRYVLAGMAGQHNFGPFQKSTCPRLK